MRSHFPPWLFILLINLTIKKTLTRISLVSVMILPNCAAHSSSGLEEKAEDDKADYWTLISLAELRVLTAENTSSVIRAYRKALTASRRNLFFLNSSLEQLEMLKALGLRDEFVQAGINTIQEEIARDE